MPFEGPISSDTALIPLVPATKKTPHGCLGSSCLMATGDKWVRHFAKDLVIL